MFWAAYALSCALFHHLLSHHYSDACRPSWWSFGLDTSAYCALVHKALYALRAAPLLAVLPRPPLIQ